MLESYAKFCYDQVGNYALEYIGYFEELRPQLSKANISASLPEYVSMMFFSGIVAFMVTGIWSGIFLVPGSGLAGVVTAVTISLVAGFGTMMGFYIYPSIMMKNRSAKIRDKMPFATMYMATLAGTGTDISEIFRALSEVDEYGEISEEAKKISRDVDTFNMDINQALKEAADRTASDDFKELMWGMSHVISSGGSLRTFLQERSEKLMNDYERRIEEFAEKLGLLVEMYITLVIVGSIIFTSMSAVISSVADIEPSTIALVQVLSIFFGLPLISGMFILLIEGISPEGIR